MNGLNKAVIYIIAAALIITAIAFISNANKASARDAHCHSRPCHASCRCCDPYRPNECPRCGAHCGCSD